MNTYNKRELASLLGITKQTLERWTNELGLPCKRRGSLRMVYFEEEQVMQWMKQRTKLIKGGY
ncbi:DNA-binding protein, excisionase family [Schinkia azotoformans MEV2011]|uniref:DNA-binding protein, excisionase family n=1 Tax=Schinkia azotoformans MEV2011 TaxID=1348973 RepID=A0A072NSU1_SCHAZ|nr:helix-turn-helix domain-containing protein [Schinkia azotoformans]KEF36290.1 DNA-binding protein, excisionase family [Schinkia azotoformans MEV2011]MEC1697873.1 helix-turn-helix domain-containing protein [Schinkia azotoformans]MEC1723152.1 helix-turn-helix domain-containing protein [Schinkia azotoformans]MEC1771874.1 helix-turn-helix domain-containing protein [Schinkia azotoformans]MEC1780274.1 helix-turn-helix domain-containing protein [Schinkia azotoformans]